MRDVRLARDDREDELRVLLVAQVELQRAESTFVLLGRPAKRVEHRTLRLLGHRGHVDVVAAQLDRVLARAVLAQVRVVLVDGAHVLAPVLLQPQARDRRHLRDSLSAQRAGLLVIARVGQGHKNSLRRVRNGRVQNPAQRFYRHAALLTERVVMRIAYSLIDAAWRGE